MNFAKSYNIEKNILIKGPKNQLPQRNNMNQTQLQAIHIVYAYMIENVKSKE